MNIGFIGLGHLGMPCALAIERYGGHTVYGCDCGEFALEPLKTGKFYRTEPGVDDLLKTTKLRVSSPLAIAKHCEIVFVAVQTPMTDGSTVPLPFANFGPTSTTPT